MPSGSAALFGTVAGEAAHYTHHLLLPLLGGVNSSSWSHMRLEEEVFMVMYQQQFMVTYDDIGGTSVCGAAFTDMQ